MAKKDQGVDYKKWLLDNFFSIASIVMVVLNLWLASKLAPLAEGIAKLDLRVSATEQRVSVHDDRLEKVIQQTNDHYADILKEIGELKRSCP